MVSLRTLSVGSIIRSIKHSKKVMKLMADAGDSFQCYEVSSVSGGRAVLDESRFWFIPKDTMVEVATI